MTSALTNCRTNVPLAVTSPSSRKTNPSSPATSARMTNQSKSFEGGGSDPSTPQ
jgi:hypothetical protein